MTTEEISDRARFFFTRINDGDVKGVGEFIDNKKIAPFNNEKGESAAAVALKSKQLAVYEALVSRAWCLNSNENFNEIVNSLEKILRKELLQINENLKQNPDELTSLIDTFLDRNRYVLPNNFDEGKSELANKIVPLISRKTNIPSIASQFHSALKAELREIHKRHFIKNPNEEHLTALITRTSIYFGGSSATTNRPKYLALIAGAYEQLNEVPEIKAILKVLANIKSLEIIFDFKRYSVEHADATGNENIYGRSYAKEGIIYLGAKALNEENQNEELEDRSKISIHETEDPLFDDDDDDDKPSRSEALGVLAHELCHVAIFRIYNNDCKPYHSDDSKSLKEFESALQQCLENRYEELIIALALKENEDLIHDELCVRVPHLLALYQGDDNKIQSLKETFKKLFDYYEKKTLRDLEMEVELMSAVWKLKSKEPQHLTDQKILIRPKTNELVLDSSKVSEISSNCPQMTLNLIFQEMTCQSSFIFLSIYHLKDRETWDLMLSAHSSCMKPRIVIDCDNETEKEIVKIAKELRDTKINGRIIFAHNHTRPIIKDANFMEISLSWSDLMDKSKETLIKKMISFQGEKILLNEVVDLRCDALDFVPLKKLLENNLEIDRKLEFPEVDIHVPRKFLCHKSEEIEPIQLISFAETSKLILLSDDPGMGKTTELKMLTIELKKKFGSFWTSFVDLKEHSEFYERDESFKTTFNTPEEIASFFATKVFKLNEFEKRVYKHLFCQSRVCLLLDGFDEISPSFKKFITMLIKLIKTHSENILITSTRPHLKFELREKLKVEAYTLMPLTEENCVKILELSIEINGVTGEDLKKKIVQTREFFQNLNKKSEPVMNPLILRMIVKVFTDDKVAQATDPNIFSIYENFMKIMIMETMGKGHDARQELTNCLKSESSIQSFYQKEALRVLFDYENDDTTKNRVKKCFDLCFRNVQSPPDEQITRIALMKSDGLGKFQFIHRTFAEFLVADFLFKNVLDVKALSDRKEKVPINKKRLKSIYGAFFQVFCHRYRYEQVRSFIDGACENLIANIEVIGKKVLLSTFYDIFTKEKLPKHFNYCFVENCLFNIINVISRCVEKEELKRLWIDKVNNYGENIFMVSACKGSVDFNTKMVALAREVLDEKEFMNCFTEKNGSGDTVVAYACENYNLDVLDYYLQSELFPSPFDQFTDVFEVKVKLIRLFRYEDIAGFQAELDKIKKDRGLEYLQRFLNSWTIDGNTFYHSACFFLRHFEDFRDLWKLLRNILDETDFKSLLKIPDSHGATPLMIKAWKCKEVFINFWKILTENLSEEEKEKLLIETDEDGDNTFDRSTMNKHHESFLEIKDLYVKTFGKDKMRIMLTRERQNGEGILFYSVTYDWDNVATLDALWTFVQEICDISTQKKILMTTNENGETFYGKLIDRHDFNEIMKIFELFIAQRLTASESKKFRYQFDHRRKWLPKFLDSSVSCVCLNKSA